MQTVRVATFDGPGTRPQIRNVPQPEVPESAALIRIDACGVCGTDLHILRGHWPKTLPWPLTLGHELAGVIVEKGSALETDFMEQPLAVGDKVMLPPLKPCGECYYCVHYPDRANKQSRAGSRLPHSRLTQYMRTGRQAGACPTSLAGFVSAWPTRTLFVS